MCGIQPVVWLLGPSIVNRVPPGRLARSLPPAGLLHWAMPKWPEFKKAQRPQARAEPPLAGMVPDVTGTEPADGQKKTRRAVPPGNRLH